MVGTDIRPRTTDAAPRAVTFFFRTILIASAILVGPAFLDIHAGAAMIDIDAGHRCRAGVTVGRSVATADGIELECAELRPSLAHTHGGRVAIQFITILGGPAIFIGSAPRRCTGTTMVDIDASRRRVAGIVVGNTVAAADRIKDVGTGDGSHTADPRAVAVTCLLGAIAVFRTIRIGPAFLDNDTWPAVIDVDAGSGGVTCIAVGQPVAAAHGIPNVRTSGRPLPADTAAVAVAIPLGAVMARRTIGIIVATDVLAWAAMCDIDAGSGSVTGIAVSIAVATANRIVLLGTDLRFAAAFADAIAITGSPSAIEARRAFVIGCARFRRTYAAAGDVHTCCRRVTCVAVCVAIATAHGIPDVRTGSGLLFADPPLVAITGFLSAVRAVGTVVVSQAAVLFAASAVLHVDALGGGETGVVVSLAVTTTDRIENLRAGIGNPPAHPFSVTVSMHLGTVRAVRAIIICATFFDHYTWPAMINIDPGSGRFARIAIGVAVATTDRIPNVGTGIGALLADTAPIAIPFFLGTVKPARTVTVIPAFTGRHAWPAVGNIDAGRRRETGIAVGLPVATANQI